MRRIPIRGKSLALTAAITCSLVATIALTANQPAQSAPDGPISAGHSAHLDLATMQWMKNQRIRSMRQKAANQQKAEAEAQKEAQKKAAAAAAKKAAARRAAAARQAAIARKRAAAAAVAARQRAAAQQASRSQARQPLYSGDPRGIAQSMLASFGWSTSQFSCLNPLWTRESGWDSSASNSSSGAYGIPQALPGSKMASAGADWQTNPATQIRWGLNYIKSRYGSPCAAYAYQNAHGYY